MRDGLHIWLSKLPYVRRYRKQLEKAYSLMSPEQKQKMRGS